MRSRRTRPTAAITAKIRCSDRFSGRRKTTAFRCCWTAPTPPTTRATGRECGRCGSCRFALLRECGLTKAEIRRLSREAGLFTWDKPAYACLATRIRTGEEITLQKLKQTEKAEGFLFGLGFRDFRVRMVDNTAKLELRETDLPLLLENREKIVTELRKDYDSVLLNLEVRK
ncbi:MAG: hypothetical protein ACLTR8_09925 [Oscillospiraceae bacterium]